MGRRTLDDEESLEALASGDLDFEQLMAQSGVERLGDKPPAKGKTTRQPGAPAQKPARPTPKAEAARPGPPRSGAEERARAYEARTEQLEQTLDVERGQRKSAAARIADLEANVAELNSNLELATAKLRVASARLDEQRDRPSIGELLGARGLEGMDARGAAVRALVDARRWESLAELLEVVDEPSARAILAAHVVLHCGRPDCPAPPHAARVPVTEERCDLCAGQGQAGLLRDISDTFLLAGVTRIGLVGGPPAQVRILSNGLDRRLELLRGQRAAEGQVQIAWNVGSEGIAVDGGLAALAAALKAWSDGL
ncbi:MAG TPA: hypothetical protein QGF58_05285 [Myxococcota bacterium]|nr:hypothetical protein [Myxococcota bacterium]